MRAVLKFQFPSGLRDQMIPPSRGSCGSSYREISCIRPCPSILRLGGRFQCPFLILVYWWWAQADSGIMKNLMKQSQCRATSNYLRYRPRSHSWPPRHGASKVVRMEHRVGCAQELIEPGKQLYERNQFILEDQTWNGVKTCEEQTHEQTCKELGVKTKLEIVWRPVRSNTKLNL